MSDNDEPPELGMDTGVVCRIIDLARPALAPEAAADLAPEDTEDEPAPAALRAGEDDAPTARLQAAIGSMTEPEQDRMLALFWVGAGDFLPAEWNEAIAAAADRRTEQGAAASPLFGSPLLAEHLEAGLEAFGGSCHGISVARDGAADRAEGSRPDLPR